jgi:hypothetical protein
MTTTRKQRKALADLGLGPSTDRVYATPVRALGRFKKRTAAIEREIDIGIAFANGRKWAKREWDGMDPRFHPRLHERGVVSVAFDALEDDRKGDVLHLLKLEPPTWGDDPEENAAYQRGFWDELRRLLAHGANKER